MLNYHAKSIRTNMRAADNDRYVAESLIMH